MFYQVNLEQPMYCSRAVQVPGGITIYCNVAVTIATLACSENAYLQFAHYVAMFLFCSNKVICMFVFGDYEFLCRLYGISGHSGKTLKLSNLRN